MVMVMLCGVATVVDGLCCTTVRLPVKTVSRVNGRKRIGAWMVALNGFTFVCVRACHRV